MDTQSPWGQTNPPQASAGTGVPIKVPVTVPVSRQADPPPITPPAAPPAPATDNQPDVPEPAAQAIDDDKTPANQPNTEDTTSQPVNGQTDQPASQPAEPPTDTSTDQPTYTVSTDELDEDNLGDLSTAEGKAALHELTELVSLENWALSVIERLGMTKLAGKDLADTVDSLTSRAEERVLMTLLTKLSDRETAELEKLLDDGVDADQVMTLVANFTLANPTLGQSILATLEELANEIIAEYDKFQTKAGLPTTKQPV